MLTLDEKKITREKEDDKDGLSSEVDVTILGLLSGKKGVKEKNEVKVEVKKTKGKQKKVTCWAGEQRKRLKKQWLNQDKEGKIEKRMRSDERKEGKKEEDKTKGGIWWRNESECKNHCQVFELWKRQYLRVKNKG